MKPTVLIIGFFLFTLLSKGQRYYPCDYESPVLCHTNGDSLKTDFDAFFTFWADTTVLLSIKTEKAGLLNSFDLKEILPCRYSSIYYCSAIEKTVLLMSDGVYQFYNFEKQKKIGPEFETNRESFRFIDGGICFLKPDEIFMAKQNGKYGMIKMDGTVALEFKFDTIYALEPHEVVFYVGKAQNEHFIIRKNGKIGKKVKLDEVIGYWDEQYILAKIKDKIVFIDEKGDIFNEPVKSKHRFKIISKNKSEFLYSRNGTLINKSPAWHIINADNSGLFILYGNMASVIDSNGVVLFENLYSAEINWTKIGYQIITISRQPDSSLLYGLYERNKNEILPVIYSKIEFNHPKYTFMKDGKKGLYVPEINLMLLPKYEEIYFNENDEPLCAKLNGKWALIDFEEKPITEYKYDSMERIFGNKCDVEMNGEKFRIDKSGNRIK